MSTLALRRRRDAVVALLGVTAAPTLVALCDEVLAYAQELEQERSDAGERQSEINLDLMHELEQVCPDCRAAIEAAMREEG